MVTLSDCERKIDIDGKKAVIRNFICTSVEGRELFSSIAIRTQKPSYLSYEISLSRLSLVGPHGRRANTRNSTLLGNGFFSIAQTNWSFSHSLQPDVNKPLKRKQGLVVACTELLYNRYCHTVYLRSITSRAT